MDLQDTVELMLSSNYKDRFTAEHLQTKERYERLKTFINRIEAAELSRYQLKAVAEPEHDCSIDLLHRQLKSMEEYLHILEIRAIIEDIPLGIPSKTMEFLKFNYNYVARDKNGDIFAYVNKPIKDDEGWMSSDVIETPVCINAYTNLFPHVKWKDESPYKL